MSLFIDLKQCNESSITSLHYISSKNICLSVLTVSYAILYIIVLIVPYAILCITVLIVPQAILCIIVSIIPLCIIITNPECLAYNTIDIHR